MPTLIEKNKIVVQPWHKQTENVRSIDYITDWISDRVWATKDTPPKIKPKNLGSKVLILRSGTGSGKSTVLPTELYRKFFPTHHKNIIITQTTIATASEIPFDIARWNVDIQPGVNIGFQTGSIARKPIKGILFSTTGILLQFLKSMSDEQFMKKYGFIIIDEVHNRSIDVDLSLFYIKQLLLRNWNTPECPFVILMSGTFEPKIFMDYFKCPKEHFIDVLGATYPTKDNFLEFDSSNWMEYAIDLIEKIHIENISDITNKNKFSDILIFLQGAAQIKKISDKIHYLNSKIFSKGLEESKKHVEEQQKKYKTGGKAGNKTNSKIDAYYLAPIALMSENISSGSKSYMDLYSNIDSVTVDIYNFDEKGERIDIPIATVPASRRIMAGSNAIETGLTIQTLGYCIDSGFVKESHFNPNFNCQVLIDKNVTQASSRQRRGRVGRNAPGVFYACYTSSVYESLPKLPFPDIVKEDISLFLLNIIIDKTKTTLVEVEYNKRTAECFQMNQFNQQWYKLTREEIFDASSLDFIQYPSADSIGYATEKLHGLGFIDHEYNPTLFGLYGSKFRKIKLENIRMILAGYHHNANILDLVTIACCIQIGHELGIQKKKYKPRNPLRVSEEEANQYYKLLFLDEFIEYLFIWDDFMNAIDSISSVLEKNIKLVKPSKGNIMPVNYLPNWCKENGFKLEGLLKVIELRDEVIETMLTMGLNPYYNGLGLSRGAYNLVNILQRNIQEGIDEIKKIKYCIYEGYRFNVCIWNNISKTYVGTYAHNNITINSKLIKPLTADDDIKQLRPQKIIVSTVTVQQNSNKNIYEFIGGDISVLDGFLDVDIEFLYH